MTTTATSFRSMDESTKEQWARIADETFKHQDRVANRVLSMLEELAAITDGFSVDQKMHSLQTATRSERGGADEEMIVASLCHDIGKVVSVPNHPAIAAEMLKPYVRPEVYNVIRTHQDFQGRHYYEYFGANPEAREQYRTEEWFSLGEQFADVWDQTSFDPDYPTDDLAHFEPLVRSVFANPKY
ncbi:MAG: HD domain-containing protein [Acidimicrobiales bacterium]